MPVAKPAFLFDLDGTLTDPFLGFTRSIQYALERLGRPMPKPTIFAPTSGRRSRSPSQSCLRTTMLRKRPNACGFTASVNKPSASSKTNLFPALSKF